MLSYRFKDFLVLSSTIIHLLIETLNNKDRFEMENREAAVMQERVLGV